jgi:FtsP/CotA-like multicopper oxidase with cupredoxin domain
LPAELSGTEFDLEIAELPVNFTGKRRIATAVNGSVPAPVLRLREGDTVTLRVRNGLKEMSSIHWHGIIVPAEMDGVPGISFAGIAPGETFTYRFEVRQSGTYWYHAHARRADGTLWSDHRGAKTGADGAGARSRLLHRAQRLVGRAAAADLPQSQEAEQLL